MRGFIIAIAAAALAMAGPVRAQVIDFEMIPGQGTPLDNQLISNQYDADFGVTFRLLENDGTLADPSIGPRIAKVGGAKTAFVGPNRDSPCDKIGPTTNDTVLDSARSGCWMLTDDGVHPGPRPFGLLIEYRVPVMRAAGELVDVDDGPEAWEITALDSLGNPIASAGNPVAIAFPSYPGAVDGGFALFEFDLEEPIYAIQMIYTGEASFGRGLAFDNFTPAALATGVNEEPRGSSWGNVKAALR